LKAAGVQKSCHLRVSKHQTGVLARSDGHGLTSIAMHSDMAGSASALLPCVRRSCMYVVTCNNMALSSLLAYTLLGCLAFHGAVAQGNLAAAIAGRLSPVAVSRKQHGTRIM
jgi:hypothetical protein